MSQISGETLGIQALRYWFNASPLAFFKGDFWGNALEYYRKKNPKFVANLGEAVRLIPINKVEKAMVELGKSRGTSYPAQPEFFDALAKVAGSVSFGEIVEAGAEGIGKGVQGLGFKGMELLTYAVIIAAIGYFVVPNVMKGLAGGKTAGAKA